MKGIPGEARCPACAGETREKDKQRRKGPGLMLCSPSFLSGWEAAPLSSPAWSWPMWIMVTVTSSKHPVGIPNVQADLLQQGVAAPFHRPREVKPPAQSHPAGESQSPESPPGPECHASHSAGLSVHQKALSRSPTPALAWLWTPRM